MKAIRLIIFLLVFASINSYAQDIPYGVNEKAGHYCNVGDAKIYYEVYGEGRPVVLLHGGYHGYIDEFKKYIPVLSKQFKVIAVATRGYGKSEIGTKPFSYRLFAEDVKKVLRQESQDSAIFIGMSDGAKTSFFIATEYPEIALKLVCLGGIVDTNYNQERETASDFKPEDFEKNEPDFVKNRKKIMPQPERWIEFLKELNVMWTEPAIIPLQKLKSVKCPVLIIAGDRDDYRKAGQFAKFYESFPNAQLAIIPNADHGDISPRSNTLIFENYILPFITK